MEQCPKCNSEQIRHVPRRYSGKDALLGGPATELIRMNSKWGKCDDCKYHWSLSNPDKGYYVQPMKYQKLISAAFLTIFGIIFLLVGIFAVTSSDVVVWRWILISLGGLLLISGIFFIIRELLSNKK